MEYNDEDISNKSQIVTLMLLLFFGSFGAHRFYVGKYATGMLYLIIGSGNEVLNLLNFKYAIILQVVFLFLMVMDLYAIYSDNFTDSKGRLIIGKEKTMIYNTYEERDQKIFFARLNKIAVTLLALSGYITFIIIRNFVL